MGAFEQPNAVYTGDYEPWVERLAEQAEPQDAETSGATQQLRAADLPQQADRSDAELADAYVADREQTADQLAHAAAASGSIGELVAANTMQG